ncbi:ferrochelatase [Pelagibacteraceae bacterium]|nr:ferrochelatase [Pelagibacteraceae bacterium]
MAKFIGNPEFKHGTKLKIGVLLSNLGTPDKPKRKELKVYLKEFLSDPRVIETPKLIWQIILNGIILNTRPQKSAKNYQKVWTDEGSPLLVILNKQKKLTEDLLKKENLEIEFAIGMRYGNPSIEKGLDELRQKHCNKIIVLPMYPHYCAATTGSTFDAVTNTMQKWRWVPSLRFISTYHDHPHYIKALANSIQQHWDKHGKPDKILFSYHGIPKKYFTNGDPYHCLCSKTTRLVREEMGLLEEFAMTTFQSRFGPEEWLQPYTDKTVEKLAKENTEHLQIIAPGFSSDCLETIEELDGENREIFEEHGGKKFSYIPCLNEQPDHINLIAHLIKNELQGWV